MWKSTENKVMIIIIIILGSVNILWGTTWPSFILDSQFERATQISGLGSFTISDQRNKRQFRKKDLLLLMCTLLAKRKENIFAP